MAAAGDNMAAVFRRSCGVRRRRTGLRDKGAWRGLGVTREWKLFCLEREIQPKVGAAAPKRKERAWGLF